MVPQERVEQIMVPRIHESVRMVPTVQTETIHEERQVPRTIFEPRCVEDRYEETRILRFDPLSGQQIDSYAAPPVPPLAASPRAYLREQSLYSPIPHLPEPA